MPTHDIAQEENHEDPVTAAAEKAEDLGSGGALLRVGRRCGKHTQVKVIGAHQGKSKTGRQLLTQASSR